MSKQEVQELTDEKLLAEWRMIKSAYQLGLPEQLSNEQTLVLFANFVNVSNELDERGLNLR